ncbi:hypothetical protein [Plebeiibacterium sediminum]|uniref:Uncharacterized protein n=1 Tax=Plebeiibacterium sediminum TaxID=2992112 RepID=A0AAE3MAK8_9BACT|nr:hypothetical protein [Plebeiobacterium sediminum]MCW3789490.1 hypothetical protein [Plebeiobacterium sediminum]
MKTITLIPLTIGTGISHFISSFAMIERNNMAIIDFDYHSIVKEILLEDEVNYITTEYMQKLDFANTRFNNSLMSFPSDKLNKENFRREFSIDILRGNFLIKNTAFLIIHYPIRLDDNILFSLMEYSDYVVFFGHYSLKSKLTLTKFISTCSKSQFGIILSKSEDLTISSETLLDDPGFNRVKLIADIPYSLKFQLATIQKKAILELNDKGLCKTIIDSWEKIKTAVYSHSFTFD